MVDDEPDGLRSRALDSAEPREDAGTLASSVDPLADVEEEWVRQHGSVTFVGTKPWASSPPHLTGKVLRAVDRRRLRSAFLRRMGSLSLTIVITASIVGFPAAAAITWALNHAQVTQAAFGLVVAMARVMWTLLSAAGLALQGLWEGRGLLLVAWAAMAGILLAVWVYVAATRRGLRRRGD